MPHVAAGGWELSGACTAESCGSCLSSFLVPVHKSRCMEVCKALARWGPVRDQTATNGCALPNHSTPACSASKAHDL